MEEDIAVIYNNPHKVVRGNIFIREADVRKPVV